jgi:DNA mismatch repair ATPase MutS
MLHSIKQMQEKIKVMKEKVDLLEKEQYNKSENEVKYRIEDIQALARDIANDTQSPGK